MAAKTGPKVVTLALQGGGAHGGYTWGVLDRFQELRGDTSTRRRFRGREK